MGIEIYLSTCCIIFDADLSIENRSGLGRAPESTMNKSELKSEIIAYWNDQACGTIAAKSSKFTREYFEEIEEYRYAVEPEIFSFAQFSRFRDQKVLEVGIGAGTDFLQWVRSGAKAHGVDLTEEAITHVDHRLKQYGLSAEEIRVADAENLPYPDDYFDLIYSFGVIHHSPDTIRALEEIIRCTRLGGLIKIMVYNRRSLNALYLYLKYGLLAGKPFRSFSDVIYHHMESLGTKAFTIDEIKTILSNYPVRIRHIEAIATSYDLLWNKNRLSRFFAYILACLLGYHRCGWFLTFELQKT
jgi:ubiquinone/menaquinone biosynthesis C-methylase UbiE